MHICLYIYIYILCLISIYIYRVITTLTTVGYGDIVPYTILEKIFSLVVMILGVGFYSYTIGNLSSILANIDRRDQKLNVHIYLLYIYIYILGKIVISE